MKNSKHLIIRINGISLDTSQMKKIENIRNIPIVLMIIKYYIYFTKLETSKLNITIMKAKKLQVDTHI